MCRILLSANTMLWTHLRRIMNDISVEFGIWRNDEVHLLYLCILLFIILIRLKEGKKHVFY